jgi:hypothetical protein
MGTGLDKMPARRAGSMASIEQNCGEEGKAAPIGSAQPRGL